MALPKFEDLIPEDNKSSLPSFDSLQAEESQSEIPWSDVPGNAAQDIVNLGKGAYSAAKAGSDAILNIGMGNLPALKDQMSSGIDIASKLPKQLVETAKGYVEHPVESFKKHPVQMGLDVASVAMPALKAAKIADIGAEAGSMAGRMAEKALPAIEDIGADARIGSMGITPTEIGTRASDLEAMNRSTKLLQENAATPKIFERAKTSLNRLEEFAKSPGQLVRQIPEYLDAYGAKPQMDSQALALHLENNLAPEVSGGAYKAETGLAKEIADTAAGHGNSFKDLLDLKQKLQETAYGSRSATTENATLRARMYQDATHMVDGIIKQEIKDAAPDLAPAWEDANRKYSAFKDVEPSMVKQQNRAASNGIMDMDITHPLRTFKRSVNTAVASITDTLTDWAKNDPGKLGKFATSIQNAVSKGPQALAATNYVLQQRDPEYADMLKRMNEEKTNEE